MLLLDRSSTERLKCVTKGSLLVTLLTYNSREDYYTIESVVGVTTGEVIYYSRLSIEESFINNRRKLLEVAIH